MKDPDPQASYLASRDDLSDVERVIISGLIDQRNAVKPIGRRTKSKIAYEGYWIASVLHEHGSQLDICTVKDLLKVAGKAGSGTFTKNSRQTKIMTLKVLARYIHRFHHSIENLDLLTDDVKAGAAESNTKSTLSLDEWKRLINTPMPAREKAMVAMLYDGYHRPGEILQMKWTDLHINSSGQVEYEVLFKTEIPRTIVQKPWATRLLKKWMHECGAKIGETNGPIFPGSDGDYYHTITVLRDVFNDLKEKTGLPQLMPSVLRNTAMKHDADASMPVSYICLRAWGVTYNKMINIYMKPDSAKIQGDQQRERGVIDVVPMVDEDELDFVERLAEQERRTKQLEVIIKEMQEGK